jgi:hypothetical protein
VDQRRRRSRTVISVIAVLAAVGGCVGVGFPPPPVGTHAFVIDDMEAELPVLEPMSPLWTLFQKPARRAPESVQVSPDGRTMYARFTSGVCAGLKSLSVERPADDVLSVSVQVADALPPGPCPGIGIMAAARTSLDPPVDPLAVTVVGPDGSAVTVDPYLE